MNPSTRIRHALIDREMSAREVYRLAEMTEATWYHRMSLPGSWRVAELVRVAEVLGVPVAELVTD